MALVPAWDKRTGQKLSEPVPEQWFGQSFADHLSPDPIPTADPVAQPNGPKGRNPKEA